MIARGPYAKGVAKREEILARALDVVGRTGYTRASVREIAEAVGLSQAGLLHYFGSREELFTAILRTRDDVDENAIGVSSTTDLDTLRERFANAIRRNSAIPGVVELFSRMSVDAADPAHPAHVYFLERGHAVRETFAVAIAHAQREGRLYPQLDPATAARMLQALSDGLQLQWLQDSTVDMAAVVDAFFEMLPRASNPQSATS